MMAMIEKFNDLFRSLVCCFDVIVPPSYTLYEFKPCRQGVK